MQELRNNFNSNIGVEEDSHFWRLQIDGEVLSSSSSDGHKRCHQRIYTKPLNDLKIIVDIPKFEGSLQPNDCIY